MEVKVLSPTMEHAEEPQLYAQTLGIARHGEQGFGGGAEEQVVDHLFVVKGEGGQRLRKSEDDVKVLGSQ